MRVAVLLFQRGTVELEQRLPAQLRRHDGLLVVRRLGELVRHLEEEQHRELLHVFHAAQSGLLQDSGVAPRPFADLGCVDHESAFALVFLRGAFRAVALAFGLPACCLRLPGAFLALGGDAFEQLAGGFVVRVLRDELAGEGVAEDGLAQRLRALQLRIEVGFEVVDDGELVFDGFDDGFLFCGGARAAEMCAVTV